MLEHLTNSRLLTMSGTSHSEGERVVDITHEALLSGWFQLRRWIDERRTVEQTRRRLEEKAAEWVRLGKEKAGLLDAVALCEATI